MIKVNGIVIEQNHFPDHTLFIKPMAHTQLINQFEWHYESDAELFTLICLRKHYIGAAHLILPYVPHARMDRVKNSEDVFTLKYFCEVINSLDFQKVKVLDVHSNVSLALLNNVEQLPVEPHITAALTKVYEDCGDTPVFYFPDEGAMKRYSEHAPGPYAFGIKKRDWETGQIQGIQIQNKDAIKRQNILIIDDICSKGGTFYHSAKALREAGAANVYLYVTHLEESVLKGDLWTDIHNASWMHAEPLINCIYTANPLFNYEHDKSIAAHIVRV